MKKSIYVVLSLCIFVFMACPPEIVPTPEEVNPIPASEPEMKIPDGFVYIKPGTFSMGCEVSYDDEKPIHQVTISTGFFMGKTEVTQAQWTQIMENNPSEFQGDAHKPAEGEIQEQRPVERVSWYDVVVYCNKRSLAEKLIPCYKKKW